MLGLWMFIACDDHTFTGVSHSADVDLTGDSYGTVVEIVSASCLGCHSNAGASGGLSLEGDICSTTVGVVSPTYGETLVVPGDHEASVLWHKCADTGTYGQGMPIGNPLPAEQADAIAQWIDEGASCEGSAVDTGNTSEPSTEPASEPSTEPPSNGLYGAVVNLFDGRCLSCHSTAASSGGLALDGDLCAELVGQPASGYNGTLVIAGDSANSVLWHKCADSGAYGQGMPIGNPLSAADLDVVTTWIDEGASCEDLTEDTGSPSDTGEPDDEISVTDGEAIYNGLCMGCHASNGVDILDESRGYTNPELRDLIQNGFDSMPPQGHLSAVEVDSVIAYIRFAEAEN